MLGQPVRWVADRRENLLTGGQAREETLDVEAAVRADGNLAAFKVRMTVDAGAYPLVTLPATSFAMMARALFPSAYRLDHYSFESVVVSTNKATAVPYRGLGRPRPGPASACSTCWPEPSAGTPSSTGWPTCGPTTSFPGPWSTDPT